MGDEHLALQGILHHVDGMSETDKKAIAGNAYCGFLIVMFLIAFHSVFQG